MWIYLSPHLDDVALSCGGLVARQVRAAERVQVWTVCAGDPPPGPLSAFAWVQHAMWGLGPNAPALRRTEDRVACRRLGARARHFPLPDCIYRRSPVDSRPLYGSQESIFGPLAVGEATLVQNLAVQLSQRLPPGAQVVSPLAVGGHVDHRLTRAAAEALALPLWYYADYPYVATDGAWASGRSPLEQTGWQAIRHALSPGDRARWAAAIAAYRSQLPVFWPDEAAMREMVEDYARRNAGVVLWRRTGQIPHNGQKQAGNKTIML